FFSVLGIQPALGRFILPGEGETRGADPVMVLGYAYWKDHFGGNPNVVVMKVTMDGSPVTIVGVAPQGFTGVWALAAPQASMTAGVAVAQHPAEFMGKRGYSD